MEKTVYLAIRNNCRSYFLISLIIIVVSITAMAYAGSLPYTFKSGTIAKSSEVNDNFNYLLQRSWELSGNDLFYNAGSVGIGTTSPTGKLSISTPDSAGNDFVVFENSTGRVLTMADNGVTMLGSGNPDFSSPWARLQVNGNAKLFSSAYWNVSLDLENKAGSGRNYAIQSEKNGNFFITDKTASLERLVITQTGNFGIGTTSPSEVLSVAGTVESTTGGFKFPDGTTQTTAMTGGIPAGGIIMWSGSIASIPSGWSLCDGSNGTPDLRDRFVVGAGSSYSTGNNGGSTSHSHGAGAYTAPSHNHGGSTGGVSFGGSGSKTAHWLDMEHTHPISAESANSITGTSASSSSLPPYYAMAYIMKL